MERRRSWQMVEITAVVMFSLALSACGTGVGSSGLGEKQTSGVNMARSSQLGWSVAASGSTVVAGAPGWDSHTGTVEVFHAGRSGVRETAQLFGSDSKAYDEFGAAVAISRDVIVAGSQYHGGSGRAYVFERKDDGWVETAELVAPHAANYEQFGESVAVSGDTIVVGAPGYDFRTGRIFVFKRLYSKWEEVAALEGGDTIENDSFGGAVAISGSTIVAGAQYHDRFVGRAYVFQERHGKWHETAELKGSHTVKDGYFGSSVAVSGSVVVVGGYEEADAAGRAYVFEENAGTWRERAVLAGGDTAPVDEFGGAVSVSSDRIAVGGEYHADGEGRAYVFSLGKGDVAETQELTGSGSPRGANFGASLAVSGHLIAVGAPREHSSRGELYVFT